MKINNLEFQHLISQSEEQLREIRGGKTKDLQFVIVEVEELVYGDTKPHEDKYDLTYGDSTGSNSSLGYGDTKPHEDKFELP